MYQLGVELGQPRLAGVVEDEHGINHGVVVPTTVQRWCVGLITAAM